MNIFVTNSDADESAKALCNKHLVKMVLETGQILSTAILHHAPDTEMLYKPTHKHHPCVVWARSCRRAFCWLLGHGLSLAEEYTHRFGREHKTHAMLRRMMGMWQVIPIAGQEMPPFVYCGPVEHSSPDVCQAYQTYLSAKYQAWGPRKARWTNSKPPVWFTEALDVHSSSKMPEHSFGGPYGTVRAL